jgi:hypothetical protein
MHRELDVPSVRLGEYRRNLLSLSSLSEHKETKKPAKIMYPKISKPDYNKDEQHEELPNTEVGTATPTGDGESQKYIKDGENEE